MGSELSPDTDEEEGGQEADSSAGGGGGGWAELGSAVLSRGWWLGKKVAIAGAAVTTAPVVIPPLIAVSAVGLAFSIPFGAFLASVACTEKIMSSLLPLPDRQELQEEGFYEEIGGESEAEIEEPFDLNSEYTSAGDDRLSDVTDAYSGFFSVGQGSAMQLATAEEVVAKLSNDEEFYSERKIWEQVVSLREIMGYKAKPQLTYKQELRALFSLIGVEAPVSFTGSSELMEVHAMLGFLKSLVGVK